MPSPGDRVQIAANKKGFPDWNAGERGRVVGTNKQGGVAIRLDVDQRIAWYHGSRVMPEEFDLKQTKPDKFLQDFNDWRKKRGMMADTPPPKPHKEMFPPLTPAQRAELDAKLEEGKQQRMRERIREAEEKGANRRDLGLGADLGPRGRFVYEGAALDRLREDVNLKSVMVQLRRVNRELRAAKTPEEREKWDSRRRELEAKFRR